MEMGMLVIYLILLISGISYFSFVLFFYSGLKRLRNRFILIEDDQKLPDLTIVIPARNEERDISETLESIMIQNYPLEKYKIIVVNDRSTDNTDRVLHQLKDDYAKAGKSNLEIITIKNISEKVSPKKNALMIALRKVTTEYVITTDADCVYDANWLRSFGSAAERSKPDIAAGLTVFNKANYSSFIEKFWQEMQNIDYFSHSMLAAGAIANKKGFTANGSNMMFKKSLYIHHGYETNDILKNSFASGDDFFLIQEATKNNNKLVFLLNEESIVRSKPVSSLRGLLNQRARWASKTTGGSSFTINFGITVFTFYFTLFITFCTFLAGLTPAWIFFSFLFVKFFPETVFLAYGFGKFNIDFKIFYYITLQIFHIPFNLISGIKGALFGFTWKGAKFRK